MLVFRTQFPLPIGTTAVNIIDLAKRWVRNSPHTSLRDLIDLERGTLEFSLIDGVETFQAKHYSDEHEELIGVNYFIIDKEKLEWTTRINFRKTKNDTLISVDIECESNIPGKVIPKARKPYLLKLIFETIGGGHDGSIDASGECINLTDHEVDFAADLINGRLKNIMPVAYVSANRNNKHVISPTDLAQKLFGIAHVVVEPNKAFGSRLKISTDKKNAHSGAVGIYWPNGYGYQIFHRGYGYEQFLDYLYSFVTAGLLGRRLHKELSFNYLEHRVNKKRFDEIKKEQSTSLKEFEEYYENELRSSDELLKESERENAYLKEELTKVRNQYYERPEGDLLNCPEDEEELFRGEFNDIIYSILKKEFLSANKGTRRYDVLKALIDANKEYGEAEKIKDEIKPILQKWEGMNSKAKSVLQNHFSISEDGKHIKLNFKDDSRYLIVLAKTPSDGRGGKNTFSDFSKIAF